MLRPWAAVVFAAVCCAFAASRVRFFAAVRVRLPVVVLGALAAVLRVVVLLRAVDRRAAGLRGVVVVVVVSAICLISPFWLDPEEEFVRVPNRGYPSNTCL